MTLDSPFAYTETPRGTSEAATHLAEFFRAFHEHYSEPRRQLLEPEIMALLQFGETDKDCVTPTEETVRQAITFAMLLPRSLVIPEVARDPDGEISFDWIGAAGKMFSVSVGSDGTLSYAGRFGEKSKVHGIEELSETLPREILLGIEKVFR
jgi:hypothetical protein